MKPYSFIYEATDVDSIETVPQYASLVTAKVLKNHHKDIIKKIKKMIKDKISKDEEESDSE